VSNLSLPPKMSFDDFGTLCRFLYSYNVMCIIYCVKNGKLSRRCNTQTCTRDALLAYSRMRVALSRSPFIAFNKAQRTGLFYIAVSWTAVEYCAVPLSLEQIKCRIDRSKNYFTRDTLRILIKLLLSYFHYINEHYNLIKSICYVSLAFYRIDK